VTSYTYNMKIYLGKDKQNATQMMTATLAAVRSLNRRVGGLSHKLYTDSLMTCTEEVSTIVGLSDRIIKKYQGTLTLDTKIEI